MPSPNRGRKRQNANPAPIGLVLKIVVVGALVFAGLYTLFNLLNDKQDAAKSNPVAAGTAANPAPGGPSAEGTPAATAAAKDPWTIPTGEGEVDLANDPATIEAAGRVSAIEIADLFVTKGPEAAFAVLQEREAQRPLSVEELRLIIDLCQTGGRIASARGYLDKALASLKEPSAVIVALSARQNALENRWPEAEADYRRAAALDGEAIAGEPSFAARAALEAARLFARADRNKVVAEATPKNWHDGSREFFAAFLDALVKEGLNDRVIQQATRPDVPLLPIERQRVLAAAWWKTGKQAQAQTAWERGFAIATEENNAPETLGLAMLANRYGYPEGSALAFDAYSRMPGARRLNDASLETWFQVALTTRAGDLAWGLVNELSARQPQNTRLINHRSYLAFVLGRDIEAALAAVEQLRAGGMMDVPSAITLSLGYAVNGRTDEAKELLGLLPVDWKTAPEEVKLIWCIVHRGSSPKPDGYAAVLGSIDRSRLLPEEARLIDG